MNRLIILLALIGCAETPHNDRGAVAGVVPAVTGDDTGLGDDTGSANDTGSDDHPVDVDGDGFSVEDDCDDTRADMNPDAVDTIADGVDQNCDGTDGVDADRDGFASEASGGDDCDDARADVNPGVGIWDVLDGVDQNCDGEEILNTAGALLLEGVYVQVAADFDGDGAQDMVLRSRRGDSYILFGKTVAAATGDITVADMDVALPSTLSTVTAGDVDGDGLADLAYNYAGEGYLFHGQTVVDHADGTLEVGAADVHVANAGSVFIHITDDLTGDGLPDLLSEGGGGDRIYTGDLSGTLDSGVDGRPIYDRSGYIHLGGLDMDSDGLPDYRVRCYDEYRRALWGHVDIDEDECTPFGEFQPTSVLRDIDGDGGQELSDGQYIQEVASFVDDGRYDYVHYSQGTYADIDGDGRTDVLYVYTPELGHPTHRVVLDVLAGDATQVVVDSTIRALFEDFSGDGLPELLFEVDVGTLMVIGQ